MKIHVLGTGNAGVTECYNTCFTIENNGKHFLIDGGGGNGILAQLKKAKIDLQDIQDIFISHAHTDHILGVLWVVRWITVKIRFGLFNGGINIYGSEIVIDTFNKLCKLLLSQSHLKEFDKIHYIKVKDGDTHQIQGMKVRFFDILAKKELQHGFDVNDNFLVFGGDEPLDKSNFSKFKDCNWLLHESFCLDSEIDQFKPYDKGHCTAKDAGTTAENIGAKNLILWHTQDNTLDTRKQTYTTEATKVFNGKVFVPNDLEIIEL